MADLSMKQFKKAVGYGQRVNKFYIRFPETFAGDNGILSYLVQSTSIPTKGMGVVTLPWQGVVTRIPGDPEVSGSWNVTFRVDAKNEVYKSIWSWLLSICDSLTNSRAALEDVIKEIDAQLLDVNLSPVSTFKILDVFVTEVGEVTMDYESENTIATWNATFAYSDIAYNFS